jgi:hypothetical protein
MGGAPQVAMHVTLQIWQIVFASQTLQVFCFCFANPLGFSFDPSQKGTICSSDWVFFLQLKLQFGILWLRLIARMNAIILASFLHDIRT